MIKYLRKIKTNVIIRLFWSNSFDSIRRHHYKMAYDQGKFDAVITRHYELMEGTYEN